MSEPTKSMKRRGTARDDKRVALAIVTHDYAYGRRKIQGIIDYYRKHCAWEILRNELSQPFVVPEDLPGRKVEGVIGEIYTPEDAENLLSLGVPVVNTSSSDLARNVPSVGVDNHAIGHMAAEHLVDCKLDNFAFIAPKGLCHVRERLDGFSQSLEKAGGRCRALLYDPLGNRSRHESEESIDPSFLKDAVASLEFPVGIMASSDRVGFAVLEA